MRKLLIILGIIAALGAGAVAQQSNVTNAVVIAALQAMGLFGDGYATGDVPTWDATAGMYEPSSGGPITGSRFIAAATATCAAPQFTVTGALTTGLAVTTTPTVLTCVGGTAVQTATAATLTTSFSGADYLLSSAVAWTYRNNIEVGWSSGTPSGGSFDAKWAREAAGHIFQRNSTNAQRASWANTYTSATNYEAFSVDWQTVANVALVGTRTAATGTGRRLALVAQESNGADSFAGLLLDRQNGISTITGTPLIALGLFNGASSPTSYAAPGTVFALANFTSTATSGSVVSTAILPTYNQTSGTAANTDLLINRTQTAVGSGSQRLIDAQVGGVSQFSVNNVGVVTGNYLRTGSGVLLSDAGTGSVRLTNDAIDFGMQLNYGTAAPTVTTCGTGTVTAGSRNVAGQVTATGATACTVTFGAPAWTNTPFCVATDGTGARALWISGATTTAFTVNGLTSGDVFTYHCIGRI